MPPEKKGEALAKLQQRLTELQQEKQSLQAKSKASAQKPPEKPDMDSIKEITEKLEEERKGTGTGRMEPGQYMDDWA
jgi:hypothetical protein